MLYHLFLKTTELIIYHSLQYLFQDRYTKLNRHLLWTRWSAFGVVQQAFEVSCPSTLTYLWINYMSTGKVPDEWRSAIVTPVHKGGLASSISNYRPISLTCVASKIMDIVVVVNLLTYLRHRNLISKQQHGFMSCKSTTTNILESLADWTLTLKKNTLSWHFVRRFRQSVRYGLS